MADIFVEQSFYMGTSDACIVDLTPPVFSGINFLDVESRGQIRAGWAAATDANAPIRYEVYIQETTSAGLFNTANIVAITPNLIFDIFTMPDGSFLVNGTVYFVGVRAVDAVSNRDTNTVSLNVISTGVLTSIDTYSTDAAWSVNDTNQFEITLWANKNGNTLTPITGVLGTASYQIYDKDGNIIVGMSGSGVSPNSAGLYSMAPVVNLLDEDREHYQILVNISVDGEIRSNYIRIEAGQEIYSLDGVSDVDYSNNLVGSFWVSDNERILTTGISNGSYQAYTANGTIIPGLSQTGIVPDVNGFYVITPFPLPSVIDGTSAYVIKLSAVVNGQTRTKNIILGNDATLYQCKGIFSINALNQLETTLWAVKNDERAAPALLGTASYTVYDKTGAAVVGLTQTGITADVNGLFHSTPVSAVLLTDLSHYSVKIEIIVAGATRTSFKGFTLLGT